MGRIITLCFLLCSTMLASAFVEQTHTRDNLDKNSTSGQQDTLQEPTSTDHEEHPSIIDHLKDFSIGIWQTELYLAKRDHYVDGKLSTIYRPVTVGKVTHLIFILLIGSLLFRSMALYLQKVLQRRFHLTFTTATLTSKWVFGSCLSILIIYGLNAVHIPFTALAFLGGTLAIGIGFGTQTILKNFISGIILMIEQPFKVGDLVDVDGINGTITNIGMRASTVKHFNGIDTLIPNSALLENKVTNWTYSNNQIRHSVTVGVSYDSPVRDVEHILLETAEEHGLVLDSPHPEVYFEDFGNSALIFRLLFWFNASEVQRPKLASDLRFMINNRLKNAGITIPYPHQNLHLDSSTPLQVNINSQTPIQNQ